MQAVLSAVGGFYTWKLASRIYGEDSRGAWATLVATIISPWQWFCSTRTLSNCLETTLTIVALDQWPWQWSANTIADGSCGENDNEMTKVNDTQLLWSLRQCLLLAAVACILRPTKIIIWTSLAAVTLIRGTWHQRKRLVREVLLCGSTILMVSGVADRLFYGVWTFPPLRFLYFNIAQSLAVFYGRNYWHHYATEGYPLLLTTTLIPFAIPGLYFAGSSSNPQFSFASLQRTAQSFFTLRSSSPWPWGKRSRMDAFLANFRRQKTIFQGLTSSWTSSFPTWSWPEWLGGPPNRKISKRERELWS